MSYKKDENDWVSFESNESTIIGRLVKKATLKEFECYCGKKHLIKDIHGFEQTGYYEDIDGRSWLLYFHCENCGYQTPLDIVLIRQGFKPN